MQSTCLVSVRVTTHSVNTSAPAEHCESTDLTACAGVEGSDALPHPASAVQRVRVMAVSVAQMVFLIVRSFDGGWRGGSRGGWLC